MGDWTFPPAWFQSVNSVAIITLAPIIAWIWVARGRANPSIPRKWSWTARSRSGPCSWSTSSSPWVSCACRRSACRW
ncbi:hypothetical protein G6F21_014667 [Rhizopus arrhizus]|nr:hypothetical protein G6F21_014667 [Rhizopus arrhizus]